MNKIILPFALMSALLAVATSYAQAKNVPWCQDIDPASSGWCVDQNENGEILTCYFNGQTFSC